MIPQVKICGNTNEADVAKAIQLGADYIGFIFTESKRRIDPEIAKSIVDAHPSFKNYVGVFYNQPKEEVEAIAKKVGLNILQFHGEETSRYCDHFIKEGYKVIKTFRIKDQMSIKRIDQYNVNAFLFDTFSRTEKGGTGETFDWSLVEDKPYVHDKLFLAGGLNVENVENGIKQLRPFAVDVASGVEAEPGKKNPALLEAFIKTVKHPSEINAKKP